MEFDYLLCLDRPNSPNYLLICSFTCGEEGPQFRRVFRYVAIVDQEEPCNYWVLSLQQIYLAEVLNLSNLLLNWSICKKTTE